MGLPKARVLHQAGHFGEWLQGRLGPRGTGRIGQLALSAPRAASVISARTRATAGAGRRAQHRAGAALFAGFGLHAGWPCATARIGAAGAGDGGVDGKPCGLGTACRGLRPPTRRWCGPACAAKGPAIRSGLTSRNGCFGPLGKDAVCNRFRRCRAIRLSGAFGGMGNAQTPVTPAFLISAILWRIGRKRAIWPNSRRWPPSAPSGA